MTFDPVAHARKNFTKHGLTETRVYNAWKNMRARCSYRGNPQWKDWGGRGIKVCDRWSKFENFLTDMGEPPPGLSLDRINNDGDYEPSNCRWATRKQQSVNSRRTRFLTLG